MEIAGTYYAKLVSNSDNKSLIVLGGQQKPIDQGKVATSNSVLEISFDKTHNQWNKIIKMPMNTPRSNFQVTKFEQTLIVSGGITQDGNATNDCEIFKQEKWVQFPPMLHKR